MLILYNVVRNEPLWSNVDFEEEVISHLNIWISRPQNLILRYRNQAAESTQLRMSRVFFLPLVSRNFDAQLSSKFHRFVVLCICWDTPCEKTGLWQYCQRCSVPLRIQRDLPDSLNWPTWMTMKRTQTKSETSNATTTQTIWILIVQHGDRVWICNCQNNNFQVTTFQQVYSLTGWDIAPTFINHAVWPPFLVLMVP